MYVNKCSKCGAEFETKNPKRVICPGCLYPDRNPLLANMEDVAPNPSPQPKPENQEQQRPQQGFRPQQRQGSYDRPAYGQQRPYQDRQYNDRPYNDRPYQGQRPNNRPYDNRPHDNRPYDNRQGGGGFRRDNHDGGQRPYNNRPYDNRPYDNRQGGGGFRRDNHDGGQRPYNNRPYDNRQGGGGGFRRPPQGGGFGGPRGGGRFGGGGNRRPAARKQLLVSREQVAEIEKLYKLMLPLPNPDAHEVIGEKIELEPKKVFFGINLVRQKMMLPKLPFPKRRLAVSPDQLMAIRNLYEPLLPLPPIGCHKFIAKQLKMDEWRVHVGIGIIRKTMDLPRWNQEREDAPEEFKIKKTEEQSAETKAE